jgi:hypothetical protein
MTKDMEVGIHEAQITSLFILLTAEELIGLLLNWSVVESSNKFLCYKQACGRELECAVLCEAVRRVSDVKQTPAFLRWQVRVPTWTYDHSTELLQN